MNLFLKSIIFLSFEYYFLCENPLNSLNCHFIDENKNEYDLSYLKKKNYWKVSNNKNSFNYYFNFCQNIISPLECNNNNNIGALETIETLYKKDIKSCRIIGLNTQMRIKPIENGLRIIYDKGEDCTESENELEEGASRKIAFIVKCSKKQDNNFVQEILDDIVITKCSLEFLIDSPAGCKIQFNNFESFSKITFLFFFLLCFGIYNIGGIIYKNKVNY